MQDLKPNFDRQGRPTQGIIAWLLRFGASSNSGALLRYLLVFAGELSDIFD
jgi:hypothetical protein